MAREEQESLNALADAWRAEPARLDLACALYDALVRRQLSLEAAEVMREVLVHRPQDITAHFRLAERLGVLGRPADAAHHLQQVIEGPVVEIDDCLYQSLALAQLGRTDEAETNARLYLTLRPGHLHGNFQLLALLIDRRAIAEAAELLGPAIESAREQTAILAPLVLKLRLHGAHEAEALLTRIAERCGNDAHALTDIARHAHSLQAPHWAVRFASQALALSASPEVRIYHDLLLPDVPVSTDDGRWWIERYRTNLERLRTSGLQVSDPVGVFTLPPQVPLFLYANDRRDLDAATARTFTALAPDLEWTAPPCRTWRTRALDRRLRVGFLTTPRYPLLWGVAGELDRRRFEVVLLFESSQGTPEAAVWGHAVDRAVAVPQDLADARETVAREELDVVICTPFKPLFSFLTYARLAPVQCVLAEPAFTDGVANLDYYISWGPAEPTGLGTHYTTAVALMERPPYWVERDYCRPAALRREDFDLPQDARWYVCPSTPLKIQACFDPLLAKVLAADPGGILVLLRRDWPQTRAVEHRLRAVLGGAADRLHILPALPADRCHALLTLADAVIDTWPIGGMSSSYAGIHVAAPTVTLPADVPFGRWLAAFYEWIGVTDLIAADESNYVELAVRLATDPEWRRDISRRIAASAGILIEDRLAVRELETFLAAAVTAAYRGEPRRDWIAGRFTNRKPRADQNDATGTPALQSGHSPAG